ncbi:hypothetical protein COLO4_32209 [Corchorus olitorius]|uniref:Uncharacterized protein n=1 Tax=Corchorus olitorius TaxID=93759 RepID=A0A1R3H0B9_9ROSI|nr:hypothetical protein COLO4_32209 [Corchorus olitorius]
MKFEIVLEALKNRHPPGDIRARFLLFQGARLGFSDGAGWSVLPRSLGHCTVTASNYGELGFAKKGNI